MEVVSRRVSSERFVGRSLQLDLLSGVLERAAQGRPSFAFVGGESGVGKTRLLREFESRAVANGARVLLGQCLELGGAQIPYAPLVGALRPLARSLDAEESEQLPEGTRNALSELLPELGGAETRADDEPSARQGRLFEAMLALLERLGRSGPVLLAIEDLHWADSSTRDFLTFLVRSAREERLCLVVTYRSDELHRRHPLRPLLAELEHAAGVERITLERFDRGELAEQLEGILQEPASPDARGAALRPLAGQPAVHRGAAGRDRGRRRLGCCPRPCAASCSRASSGSRPPPRLSCAPPPCSTGRSRTGCSRPSPACRRPRSWTAPARRSPTRCSSPVPTACTRSATRWSARRCTTTCSPARTRRCTSASRRRWSSSPSSWATSPRRRWPPSSRAT